MYEEIFYDISNKGFVLDISSDDLDSFIKLTWGEYETLLQKQSQGKVIKCVNGKVVAEEAKKDGSSTERAWRNAELYRADIELNKVQDSDVNATGSVGEWRAYRKELRQYPQQPGFPSQAVRPVAPDA